mmetsp:Transcript_10345/g.16885  ORF Transcript_10345/g.16885 Transcript_10345/m.16885 type:complete len:222 (-) Transcript_10345:1053-1718(-)
MVVGCLEVLRRVETSLVLVLVCLELQKRRRVRECVTQGTQLVKMNPTLMNLTMNPPGEVVETVGLYLVGTLRMRFHRWGIASHRRRQLLDLDRQVLVPARLETHQQPLDSVRRLDSVHHLDLRLVLRQDSDKHQRSALALLLDKRAHLAVQATPPRRNHCSQQQHPLAQVVGLHLSQVSPQVLPLLDRTHQDGASRYKYVNHYLGSSPTILKLENPGDNSG